MGKTLKFKCKDDSISKVCWNCKNFSDPSVRNCRAFPNGIPEEIWNARNSHTEPYPGDNGIRFEPIFKEAA